MDASAPSPSSVSGPSFPTHPTSPPSGPTCRRAGTASATSPTAGTPISTTTPTPRRPDKTYSKIGGWVRDVRLESHRMAHAHPAQGRRRDGPRPEVGGGGQPTGARWTTGTRASPRTPSGSRSSWATRWAVTSTCCRRRASSFPRSSDELSKAPELPGPARRRAQGGDGGAGGRACAAASPTSPRTPCPGSWATSWRGASRPSTISRAPTTSPTPRAPRRMAAMSAAAEGLIQHDYDAVLTGGIDANMSASTFVKFSKIGALSATGSRPYAEGADGFVMGEGGGGLPAQAPGRRRARRRQGLRRAPGRGRLQRRQGQGDHRAQPRRARSSRCGGRWERAGVAPAAGD